MTKVLITGSGGQLGLSIQREARQLGRFACTFIDINELDLTNREEVHHFFGDNHYDYIINCAAFTNVDLAEKESEVAFRTNRDVPGILAEECNKNTRLIHISTDYIYDGSACTPHLEEEDPKPESVYAQSKLDGEKVLWENPFCIVLRISWLYSEFGNNFLKTMIRLSSERQEIGVVYDQTGTPTYAGDLAKTLFKIIGYSEENVFEPGIYNYSNEGVCSWYDFAYEIMKITGSNCRILPIRTVEYPLPAKRPAYSVMDKSKIKRIFDIEIPYWRESLHFTLNNLKENNFNKWKIPT